MQSFVSGSSEVASVCLLHSPLPGQKQTSFDHPKTSKGCSCLPHPFLAVWPPLRIPVRLIPSRPQSVPHASLFASVIPRCRANLTFPSLFTSCIPRCRKFHTLHFLSPLFPAAVPASRSSLIVLLASTLGGVSNATHH